jgi:catechol 2,3-dioxygenase-like lactoylglutathione lyase family enzyme
MGICAHCRSVPRGKIGCANSMQRCMAECLRTSLLATAAMKPIETLRGFEMLSYVYLGTNNLARATAFYDATLAPLGMQRCITDDPEWDRLSAGWGVYEDGGARELALWVGKPFDQHAATSGNGVMVAFRARSWKEVDAFHAAALAQGGHSEGAPSLRLHYGSDFYAAYIRDLDGNKLAAVCRGSRARS